jgi:hypothetical protein
MFGTKKGKVAPASVLGPKKGKGSAKGKAGMQKLGETGKAASAGGKKVN